MIRNLFYLLVGTGVVFFWRGAWGLLDLYFFPGNPTLSYILSIVVGVAITLLTNTWNQL